MRAIYEAQAGQLVVGELRARARAVLLLLLEGYVFERAWPEASEIKRLTDSLFFGASRVMEAVERNGFGANIFKGAFVDGSDEGGGGGGGCGGAGSRCGVGLVSLAGDDVEGENV